MFGRKFLIWVTILYLGREDNQMLYPTQDGALLNLNYIGAVYMRKAKNSDTFDVFAIPYDRINRLASTQPHESNPKYEPIESFEILIRQGLSKSDATTEMLSMAKFMNTTNVSVTQE